ncbi:hypothetical protein D3C75_1040970 [compost metagenome]
MKSAFIPAFRTPVSGSHKDLAPSAVPMRNATVAGTAVGSPETPLWIRAARRASSNISRLLLLAELSVPRETRRPAASRSGTRATPLASLRLLPGLWLMRTSYRHRISISSSVKCTPCAIRQGRPNTPSFSRWAAGRSPYWATFSSTSRMVSDI